MQSRTAKFFLLIFLSCLFTIKLSAQISASVQQGCAPLINVHFTGLPGAAGVLWNFADGSSANVNNPDHTFTQPGNYVVTYTASVSGSPVSQNITINVYGPPNANFTVGTPANGCAPLPVSFTDLSTGGGGVPIVGWSWLYGDFSAVGTTQNPTYSYTTQGLFSITLLATDANGCIDSFTVANAVAVSLKPTVIISNTPASLAACASPFVVTFDGTFSSSHNPPNVAQGLTYQWDFGNSVTSNSATPPAVTYTAPPNSYTVSLTCTDNNNCSQVATKTVTITQPQVKAVVIDSLCLGDTLRIRDTSFASTTVWNFGDGTPNQTVFVPNNVKHFYAASGTYTITATSSIGPCSDVETFIIVIDEAIANFSTNGAHYTCQPTLQVDYINQSTGATHYIWNFPTNVPNSNATDTSVIFSQNSFNEYTIFEDLPLTTQLIAISALGCRDTIERTLDTIHRPTAFFYTDGNEGCAPLTIEFTDSSFSVENIISYSWYFDDGSPMVGGGPNDTIVTHIFADTGLYHPYLIIENANGCIDTSFLYPVWAADPPGPDFSFSPSTVCPQDTVFITNNTNPADSVNHWHVISDATYFSGCINDPNPGWLFTHAGVHNVTLVGYTHECRGDSTPTLQVTVKGPIATGRHHTQCGPDTLTVMFEAFLQDAQSATWDYGDGTTETVTGNGLHTTTHTYPGSGDYDAVLTGVNGTTGCIPYVDSLKVKVRSIRASFTNDSIVCSGIQTIYNAVTSHDVFASCGLGYQWYFTNHITGTPVTIPPFVTPGPMLNQALPEGVYTIMMWVKDENECHDTTTGTIRISGVDANFSVNNSVGCLPAFNLATIQGSTSDSLPLTYVWTFGDGPGTATGPNPTHTYTAATSPSQNYTVTMTATNPVGCFETTTQVITVNAPVAAVSVTMPNYICANHSATFTGSGITGANLYQWNYGDGSPIDSTLTAATTHTYTTGGTYTVQVVISDAAGCKDTSNNVNVFVQDYPIPAFSIDNLTNPGSTKACVGSIMQFTDISVINQPPPGPRQWNLGPGTPTVSGPTATNVYNTPGNFPITLTVSTTYGCQSVITDSIRVYGALANLSLDRNTICKSDSIQFSIIDTSDVYTWHWDFGDGTDADSVSPIYHQYNFHPPGGSTNVSLVYWTADSACRYSTVQTINIREVIADFDRNAEAQYVDSLHCLGTQDLFNNTSANATSYHWDFGVGSTTADTSNAASPLYLYDAPGTYTVTLAIADVLYGCVDTLRKPMVIYPIPSATITGDSVCLGSPATLVASGDPGVQYAWLPATGLSDDSIPNPIVNITQTTTFTVTAYMEYNGGAGNGGATCSTELDTMIYVQQPPAHIDWDTSIIIGQTAPIPGYAGVGMTYLWTPTTDLSCATCPNPTSSSLVNIVYTASVSDVMNCFTETNTFTVEIIPKSTVDVPTAFTPDGDGVNDIIYVDGWGIKKLIYFRIYNRWGQLLFESTDLKTGWDGYYNGVLQNMETYVYQVSAQTYTDADPKDIKGYFKLIR